MVQATLWGLILDTDKRTDQPSRLNFFSYDSGPPGWLTLIFRDPGDHIRVVFGTEAASEALGTSGAGGEGQTPRSCELRITIEREVIAVLTIPSSWTNKTNKKPTGLVPREKERTGMNKEFERKDPFVGTARGGPLGSKMGTREGRISKFDRQLEW